MRTHIENNQGQVAHQIINQSALCPGQDRCPFERSEEERQKRFEAQTGISCSRGAREALQHLLETGVFDYKQLAISWRSRSLWWDWDAIKLRTTVSRLESAYGSMLVLLGIVMVAGAVAAIIVKGSEMPAYEQVLAGVLVPVGLMAAMLADRTMIRPNRIARRVEPFLQSYYQGRYLKPSLGMAA